MIELSKEYLNYLFCYDGATGVLTRKVSRSNSVKIDGEVGCMGRDGYLRVRVDKDLYLVHRVIWVLFYGQQPKGQVDHINGDPKDNSILNLRDTTPTVNSRNTKMKSNNKSGVSGVFWRPCRSKFIVSIYANGKSNALGSYDNLLDAACARFSANNKYGCTKRHGRSG